MVSLDGVPFLWRVVWLAATVVGTFPRKSRFFWLEMTQQHGRQLQQWWTGVMRVGAISFLPTLLLSRTWAPTSALPHTLITRLSLQPNRLNYCFFLLNFVRHYSDHDQSISCPIFWQLLCYFVKVDSQPSSSQSVGVFKTEFELSSNLFSSIWMCCCWTQFLRSL